MNNLFQDLKGQELAKIFLTSILEKDQYSSAYLFSGPKGIGKKLAALRFIEGLLKHGVKSDKYQKRLNEYNHPDFLLVEPTYQLQGKLIPASQSEVNEQNKRNPPKIRLEQIREVTRFLGNSPLESNLSVVLIEEVETMAEAAANALLKTLEEPSNGVIILITSRPEKLLPTINSRCQRIPFYPLNQNDCNEVLLTIKAELSSSSDFTEMLNQQELQAMANGSPGALIENFNFWNDIPDSLWRKIKNPKKSPLDALSLAKEITESLDTEQQIWLISWIQQHIWNKNQDIKSLKKLEELRNYLISFVQPRLAWEITLLEISKAN